VWSRRTKGVVRDEAMNERRVEERSREEVWGGMWWWNDDMEGEEEKEAQTEFFQAHTRTNICMRMRNSTERQFPSGIATVPIFKNSKITITNIYLI
jgi:hypothetical protein